MTGERYEQAIKLSQTRASAEREREQCLAIESERWDWMSGLLPVRNDNGEATDFLSLPGTTAQDTWAMRLVGDLLGCSTTPEQVDETLRRYFDLVRDPEHLYWIYSSALAAIATVIVPKMLDGLEKAGNYDARVALAEMAAEAWKARVHLDMP